MKPQILKLTGINSFNETQEIDFSNILNIGIFGIFGDTGSGKSTIIDAITLSLYGRIVRYNKGSNGDFINLSRKDAKVEFTFSIKDGKEEKFYHILRRFKRDSKGGIKSDIVRLSSIQEDKIDIISDKKKEIEQSITNIIGLSYDDFTKAVVLPQGKFSDFLLLENSDKRKMLQRIFGLERYGEKLQNKINEKKNCQDALVKKLKTQMEFYGQISEADIKLEREKLLEEINKLKVLENNLRNILEKEKVINSLLNLKNEYIFYDLKLNELLEYEKSFIFFTEGLEKAIQADKIMPHIQELERLENEKNDIDRYLQNLKLKFEKVQSEFKENEKFYNTYKHKKENEKPNLDKIKIDLENCLEILKEKETVDKNIQEIDLELKNLAQNKVEYLKEIAKIENTQKDIREKIILLEKFNDENKINDSFKEKLKNIIEVEKNIEDIKLNLELLQEDIKSQTDILQNLLNQKENTNFEILSKEKAIRDIILYSKKNIHNDLDENNKNINCIENENLSIRTQIETLGSQIKIQENKELLQELKNSLIENNPCPLCGSTNHPNPIEIVFDTMIESLKKDKLYKEEILKINEERVSDLKAKNIILNKCIEDIMVFAQRHKILNFEEDMELTESIGYSTNILEQITELESEINTKKQIISSIDANIENIKNLVKEKTARHKEIQDNQKELFEKYKKLIEGLNIENYTLEYEKILGLEKILQENIEELVSLNKKIENINNSYYTEMSKINEIDFNLSSFSEKKKEKEDYVKQLSSKIKLLSYGKEPKQYLCEIDKEIVNILENDKHYFELYNKSFELKNKIEKVYTENTIKQELNSKALITKEDFLKNSILESIFENIEEVKANFKNKEIQKQYEEKIQSYKDKLFDYKNNLKRIDEEFAILKNNIYLQQKGLVNMQSIDIESLTEDLSFIKSERTSLEVLNKNTISTIAKLEIDIDEKIKDFHQVSNIRKELKNEERKLDIFKELSDLNKGGLFVEYVANRQLKHIVFDASSRLLNMSQNKYSLEILDGSFIIKDHYNGGILRSARSLSGGELFMASLSLALALSSKIQLKNKSPLEVFFLDEGFGTLDNNLLDTVINTLEQLQNDNIDVGIITHVEEIKNRVHNKIVIKSNESGSKINIE